MNFPIDLKHIRKLLSEGQLKEALDELYLKKDELNKVTKNELTLIRGHFSRIQGKINTNAINTENEKIELNQITQGVLGIIGKIEQQSDERENILIETNEKSKPTLSIWGSIVLVVVTIIGVTLLSTQKLDPNFGKSAECNLFSSDSTEDNLDAHNLLLFSVGVQTPNIMGKIQEALNELNIIGTLNIDMVFDERFRIFDEGESDISEDLLRSKAATEIPKIGKACNADIVVWGYPSKIDSDSGKVYYECLKSERPLTVPETELAMVINTGYFETLDLIPIINFMAGRAEFEEDRLQKALKYFYLAHNHVEKYHLKGRGLEQIDYMIASSLRKTGEFLRKNCKSNAAKDSFTKAIDFYIKAIEKAKERKEDFVEAYHDLGLVYWYLGNLSKAKEFLKESKYLIESDAVIDKKMLGLTLFNLSAVYVTESISDSIKYYAKESLKISPDTGKHKYARINLAIAYEMDKDYTKADSLINLYLNDYPQDFEGLHTQGIIMMEMERVEEALFVFNKLLDQRPCQSSVLVNKGNLLFDKTKDYSGAKEVYIQAISYDSTNKRAWEGLFLSTWEAKEYQISHDFIKDAVLETNLDSTSKNGLLFNSTNYAITDGKDEIARNLGALYSKTFPKDPYSHFFMACVAAKDRNTSEFYKKIDLALKLEYGKKFLVEDFQILIKKVGSAHPLNSYIKEDRFIEMTRTDLP